MDYQSSYYHLWWLSLLRIMVIFLDKHDSLSWALIPAVFKRIRKFIKEYHTDGDPKILTELIEKHFIAEKPLMLMVAGVEDGEVVGHILAAIDEFTGKRWLTILQLDIDKKYRKQLFKERKVVWEKLLDWGRLNFATEVQILTPTDSRTRLFEKYFGLKQHRILMRGPI